jgi:phospholipid/cholesterol/gamma-HCH transport system permease protein
MLVADRFAAFGHAVLTRTDQFRQGAAILLAALRAALRLRFLNAAVRAAFVSQLEAVALSSLPSVVIVALLLGGITVHYVLRVVLDYIGAYEQLGSLLVRVMLEEIGPLATVLIIMLRSGSAVIAEVATMKINNELESLRVFGVGQDDYLFLPRVLAFAVAGPSLTMVFCLVGLVGSFLILGYFHDITFGNYLRQLYTGVEVRNLVVLLAKPVIMAVAVAVVCLQRGLSVGRSSTEVPLVLSQGMMLCLTTILVIELAVVLFFTI